MPLPRIHRDTTILTLWSQIADAAGLTVAGAKHATAIGALPVVWIGSPDGAIPAANPSALRAYRERREARLAETEKKMKELDARRAALIETVEV